MNPLDICKAVAAGDLPVSVIKEFSKTELNNFAKRTKMEGVLFGIEVIEEPDVSAR